MKYLEKIQSLLPLGYMYLIVLGLLKETIFFYPLGINILNYSSITDILISPISDMTSNPILILVVLSVVLLFFLFQILLVKYSHKNWIQKILKSYRMDTNLDKRELRKAMIPAFVMLAGFELLALFIGLGLGQGEKIKKRLDSQTLQHNYILTTGSGERVPVYLIDINSIYYFYVKKDEKQVRIAPVGGIGNIEVINNK
ncbi:hypothetical protein B0A69_21495 [Chryseobacterium shigense]|uniref:Uncharacterized protein n=1 Tax=Chryseobacterium shigense TaxID=297244 RepID=A0A1N7IJI3_9FLAO|nr:hypothetical protein [Chryseobacterium shigense]PQA89998.1 hypothetical protein B0A69_21495 [Chryseobacterium shigense]SIS37141.1 hypothetical protein SAMN05421639_10429 [Chryseobacterium shigense]